MSSNGSCFDIGNTVRSALNAFEGSGNPFSGSTHPRSAGNGSIMRLAPVPMAFAGNLDRVTRFSRVSSQNTHGAETCVDGCRYMGNLIARALAGVSKEELLSRDQNESMGVLHPEILKIARGSYIDKEAPEIRGTGYVVESRRASWAIRLLDASKQVVCKWSGHCANLIFGDTCPQSYCDGGRHGILQKAKPTEINHTRGNY